ncbi:TetR/AcrR family transcriptional regulator [Maledivibacter halophilus]|uniref:Transcriptional regulator, TetR family n=1 Tax=Maledivibacter halophilus TaxID=36842 RepID=A0A1T5MJZ9_9FIRM|nr:TetR/AcrR family transcriptional regulator [Maledivibacter halophilus]SKC88238.1 transcriptional regulator, TetR family [Maledivibacter halophilus]
MISNNDNKNLTKRQKKALETKKRLYDAALELFKEKGYKNVSVDEIVAKANTSKGSFYTHFESKDQIIIEHFKNNDNHYAEYYKNLKSYKTSSEKLLNFAKNMFSFVNEKVDFDFTNVIYSSQLLHNQEKTYIIKEDRSLYKILYEIIREGQKLGEFREDYTAEELVKMAARSMRGTYYDWCLYDGNFDIVDNGVKYFSLFVEGIEKVK